MKTIVCGVDGSPGARSAVRVAAVLAQRMSARLVAVHVGDRSSAGGDTAERVAAAIVAEEVPNSHAEARGATGDVAECLATFAWSEDALMIVVGARRRGRSRAFLRARSAVGLVGLTDIPVLVAPLATRSTDDDPVNPTMSDSIAGPGTNSMDAYATVEEQRRIRRKARVPLRPWWSRGHS